MSGGREATCRSAPAVPGTDRQLPYFFVVFFAVVFFAVVFLAAFFAGIIFPPIYNELCPFFYFLSRGFFIFLR